ncbi:MAG: Xaa-Pro dipeptidase [Motiliproteus sp.]
MSLEQIFSNHFAVQLQLAESLLAEHSLEHLLIFSGSQKTLFRDDHHFPFVANPYFRRWLPLSQHANCALLIRPGQKPRLYYFNPTDLWHLSAGDPEGFWVDCVEIIEIETLEQIGSDLLQPERTVFIGEEAALAQQWGITQINPKPLLAALDWAAGVKTDYELECLREANSVAAEGHLAAAEAFAEGYSEFGINLSYLAATGQRESQLPYGNIVALNEHAAILHYQQQSQQRPEKSYSFLLDAGAQVQGYAADISRSYVAAGARKHTPAGALYAELIEAMEQMQLQLCQQAVAGQCFVALNQRCHQQLAEILARFDLVRLTPDEIVAQGITRTFMPHGLGHLLGTLVHDAGGRQTDPLGALLAPPAEYPMLRLTRTLQPGMVVTIEPGLYFIEPLLAQLATSPQGHAINLPKLDKLRCYGGIRIEDNIHVLADGIENLTRDAFAELDPS